MILAAQGVHQFHHPVAAQRGQGLQGIDAQDLGGIRHELAELDNGGVHLHGGTQVAPQFSIVGILHGEHFRLCAGVEELVEQMVRGPPLAGHAAFRLRHHAHRASGIHHESHRCAQRERQQQKSCQQTPHRLAGIRLRRMK